MFYQPSHQQTGIMWDTWLAWHDGTYCLYYLARTKEQWDNISMATSPDGVHWHEIGPILFKRPDAMWMGTGSVWKSPDFDRDRTFIMNFSEWNGPRQNIFFAESQDLLHWKRLGDEYAFAQDERWYQPRGRWDCIWTIDRAEGGLYGYWTASPKKEMSGRFGFGQSLDGRRWEALQPPVVLRKVEGEVGAIDKIGSRYYMMFGNEDGMCTLVADQPAGPFRKAEKNAILLRGSWSTYFSRFFPSPPDGLLVNHHIKDRNQQVSLGLLKRAVVDEQGTLRFGWWEGNEKLKSGRVAIGLDCEKAQSPVTLLNHTFNTSGGVILEGQLLLPKHPASARRGLLVQCNGDLSTMVLLDAQGRAEFGSLSATSRYQVEHQADRDVDFGSVTRFRLALQRSLLEFYLNDVLLECFSLPSEASGSIGLIFGDDSDAFGELRVWQRN